MTSAHRLIATIIIWAASAWALFFALGQSLFMPPTSVVAAVAFIAVSAFGATFFVARALPPK